MSPDATAFAHLVDDGGFPRAVQRFLRGWRASSSRDVELPVEGPVTRVMHSADGHWLACQVAPDGGTRSQIWVVTTDPDDRDARRIDHWPPGMVEGTAELIGWDGTQVAAILTGEDGVGSSCLIDPADGGDDCAGPPLRRQAGRRVGRRRPGAGRTARLPRSDHAARADRNRAAAIRSGLDDGYRHHPRRPRPPPVAGRPRRGTQRALPARATYGINSTDGFVRALIRSENGAEHARLLEVTTTADGVSYQVVAERPGYELDEFTVSDDLSTVAMLWNINGASELQILEYADYTLHEPIPLPGMVASELSISAGGSMLAMTVESPSMPPTVELVDPRTREWEPIDREPSRGPVSRRPDAWKPSPRATVCSSPVGCSGRRPASNRSARCCSCTVDRKARADLATTSSFRHCSRPASPCFSPTCGGRGDSAGRSCTPTTGSGGSPPSTTSPMRRGFSSTAVSRPRIASRAADGPTAAI